MNLFAFTEPYIGVRIMIGIQNFESGLGIRIPKQRLLCRSSNTIASVTYLAKSICASASNMTSSYVSMKVEVKEVLRIC